MQRCRRFSGSPPQNQAHSHFKSLFRVSCLLSDRAAFPILTISVVLLGESTFFPDITSFSVLLLFRQSNLLVIAGKEPVALQTKTRAVARRLSFETNLPVSKLPLDKAAGVSCVHHTKPSVEPQSNFRVAENVCSSKAKLLPRKLDFLLGIQEVIACARS